MVNLALLLQWSFCYFNLYNRVAQLETVIMFLITLIRSSFTAKFKGSRLNLLSGLFFSTYLMP